jgi:hypothetical protein
LEHQKFVECPSGSGKPAVRTSICQEEDETIKVELGECGESINIFSESLAVAASATTTILTYTVPPLKLFKLKRVDISGTNRGIYSVDFNTAIISKKRTNYISYDDYFKFEDIKFSSGDIIKIIVENKNNTATGDFNTNLQGNLFDA